MIWGCKMISDERMKVELFKLEKYEQVQRILDAISERGFRSRGKRLDNLAKRADRVCALRDIVRGL